MPLAAPDPNSKYNQGEYTPKNPEKYIGKYPIIWRSSWELEICKKFDESPHILQWSSESLPIPYMHPFTKRMAHYYPDFFIIYVNRSGQKKADVIEIKPSNQSVLERAKNQRDQIQLVLNSYKWDAAEKWCLKRGFNFRVWTEEQLYQQGITQLGGKYARMNPRKTKSKSRRTSIKRKATTRKTTTARKRSTTSRRRR